MSHFCLLRDPDNYVAHDWKLTDDKVACNYWLDLFAKHFESTLDQASSRYGQRSTPKIEAARKQFSQTIEQLQENPASLPGGNLDIMTLCQLREKALRNNGLNDPFSLIKERENASATELYPQVVRKVHAMDNEDKWLHLIECVFAGNIFDLGSPVTMGLAHESVDFLATVEQIKPRPWLADDFDRLLDDLRPAPPTKWAKAVVFVDNAGSDLILGIMPLVRELALEGTSIVLAANELPSLNDVTADETADIVENLAITDHELAALIEAGMFEVVSTGNDLPLIDLSDVSEELNEASQDADLVILEGMGRAVESNYDATFSVDSIHLALLKDALVSKRIGGEVFDCICKYSPID